MGEYTFRWEHPAQDVYVTGTFDNWGKSEQLTKKEDGVFEKTVTLPKSEEKILYKFVADGDWNYNHTAKTEKDHEGNINNVLYPEDIKPSSSSNDPTISSVAPGASTAAMAGATPLEHSSSPPGAFPETPATEFPPSTTKEASATSEGDPSVSVNPLPATSGTGNPVSLPAGEKVPDSSSLTGNTVDSNVKLDEDSYNKPDTQIPSDTKDAEQSVSVNPLPATGGIGNPVSLSPGEQVPDSSSLTGNTINSNVKLDEDSYNKPDAGAPVLPAALSPDGEKEAFGEKAIFGGLGPQTSNIIPESSLPMGDNNATAPISQYTSSVGPQSTTNELAGQQPIQERSAAPEIVQESQQEAGIDPEASANPRAVEEKDQVENELHSKVPEAPAASESGIGQSDNKGIYGAAAGGVAALGAAAAGAAYSARDKVTESTGKDPASMLPPSVQDSINNMNNKGSSNAPAPVERDADAYKPTESEAAIPQQTAVGQGISVPAEEGVASGVPEEVLKSEKEAMVDPEAAANPEAVQEKSEVERELLSKVPESEATGEPAPHASESGAIAGGAAVGAAGLGAGAAALSSNSDPITEGHERAIASSVPEEVVQSQQEANIEPSAIANPEAVQDKAAVEQELLSQVPESSAGGEPAPEVASSVALSSAAPISTSDSGAPQLGDPTTGVAPLTMDNGAASGSSGLNAPASEPAVPLTQQLKENSLPAPVSPAPERSRDVSPMTKTAGSSSQPQEPTVTTGVESAAAPAEQSSSAGTGADAAAGTTGNPVGTQRPAAAASTPTSTSKRQSFLGKSKGTPESGSGEKKKGFFKRLAEKMNTFWQTVWASITSIFCCCCYCWRKRDQVPAEGGTLRFDGRHFGQDTTVELESGVASRRSSSVATRVGGGDGAEEGAGGDGRRKDDDIPDFVRAPTPYTPPATNSETGSAHVKLVEPEGLPQGHTEYRQQGSAYARGAASVWEVPWRRKMLRRRASSAGTLPQPGEVGLSAGGDGAGDEIGNGDERLGSDATAVEGNEDGRSFVTAFENLEDAHAEAYRLDVVPS